MNPEAQRIAIAQACGLEAKHVPNKDCKVWARRPGAAEWGTCPDYLNDLNAMHEAEKQIAGVLYRYCEQLTLVCETALIEAKRFSETTSYTATVTATAAQRAEAFLRTLNLWQDTQGGDKK